MSVWPNVDPTFFSKRVSASSRTYSGLNEDLLAGEYKVTESENGQGA